MCPVFVAFIVALFINCTVGTLFLTFIYVRTNWSSVRHKLFDAPLSDFAIIVACLGGSTIELHNSLYVKEVLFYTALEVLAGTKPDFRVQLRSLPDILLHQNVLLLWPYTGVMHSVPGWENIPCVQQ